MGEERNDGDTGVATNNGNDGGLGSRARNEAGGELRSADDVKSGDTEEPLGVEGAGLLEDGGNNWDSATNREWLY